MQNAISVLEFYIWPILKTNISIYNLHIHSIQVRHAKLMMDEAMGNTVQWQFYTDMRKLILNATPVWRGTGNRPYTLVYKAEHVQYKII